MWGSRKSISLGQPLFRTLFIWSDQLVCDDTTRVYNT